MAGNQEGGPAHEQPAGWHRDWLLIVLLGVVALETACALVVLAFVYPRFVALFKELGVRDLPLPTLMLMRVSHLLTSKWWIVAPVGLLIAVGIVGGVVWVRQRAIARGSWDRVGRPIIVGLTTAALVMGFVLLAQVGVSVLLPIVAIHGQLSSP